jgi:hypothetical protein
LALLDIVARLNPKLAQMSIIGAPAITVVDDDQVAVTPTILLGLDHTRG